MKKRTILFFILLVLAVRSSFGQIIFTEEDAGLNPRAGGKPDEFGVMVPLQNVNYDQFKTEVVPVGNGLLLLIGLGGAYLLKKRKETK